MTISTFRGWKCNRCFYRWMPRREGYVPKECPGCKSRYWNKRRVRKRSVGKVLDRLGDVRRNTSSLELLSSPPSHQQ